MPDIPYGDCFTVEARWDISPMTQSPGQPPALSVKTHVMVDFAKTTIWRKAIESGVINSCRGSHEEWLAAAQKCAATDLCQPAVSECALHWDTFAAMHSRGTALAKYTCELYPEELGCRGFCRCTPL